MCNPAAAALFVAGTGLQYKAQKDAAEDNTRDRLMFYSKGDEIADQQQSIIDQQVQDQLPEYETEATQARINDQTEQVEGSVNEALAIGNANFGEYSGTPDNTGDAYERAQAQHTLDNERDAVMLAKQFAKMSAPNLVNLRDASSRQDTGWNIQAATDRINRGRGHSQTAASLVNHLPNPWMMLGGQAMSTAGAAGVGGGISLPGGAAPASAVNTTSPGWQSAMETIGRTA